MVMSVSIVCVCKLVLFLPAVVLALGTHRGEHILPDGSRIYYDGAEPINQRRIDAVFSNSTVQAPPIEFLKNISGYEVNDLLANFVEYDDYDDEIVLRSRFNGFGEERNSAVTPKSAACLPELQTVNIAPSDDPTVVYIPQCTRIERCGGCCSHKLLSCQPKQTEIVNFQVMKTQYRGGRKLKFVGKEVKLIERHLKCKCDCKMRAEDCNAFQEYRQAECRCACVNFDDEKKCEKNSDLKLWNPEICVCQCRNISQCSTGFTFDHNECRCVRVPMKRRYAPYELKSFGYDP